MNIRQVPAAVFLPTAAQPRPPSPRELKRRELEAALGRVIAAVAHDSGLAFLVTLEEGEKLPTVRAAFNAAKAHQGGGAVNLVTVAGNLYIAATPLRRGRRAKGD